LDSRVSSTPHMKGKLEGGITVSLAKRDPTVSSTDQLSIPSSYLASDFDYHLKIEQETPSGSTASSSVDSFESRTGSQSRSPQPEAIVPAVDYETIRPDSPAQIDDCGYFSDAADTISSV